MSKISRENKKKSMKQESPDISQMNPVANAAENHITQNKAQEKNTQR